MKKTLVLTALILAGLGSIGTKSAQATTNRARAWYIISHVFPGNTKYKAFQVAECETAHFTDFWNDRSGAKGLFQEMPGNDNRIFYWNGLRLKLDWSRISRHRPDWYSAKIALYQSYGGTNWNEWECG